MKEVMKIVRQVAAIFSKKIREEIRIEKERKEKRRLKNRRNKENEVKKYGLEFSRAYHRAGKFLRRETFVTSDYTECASCKEIKHKKDLEVDHIIPIIAGGSNERCNLQFLCKTCHRIKTREEFKTICNKK